ncbi:MAG: hypothetical protein D6788_01640, partial [Planctomycetota bacterium]
MWSAWLTLTAAAATAQVCQPPVVNVMDMPSAGQDVAVEGDLLLVAHRDGATNAFRLLIYTLAPPGTPTDPVLLAGLDLGTG